MFLQRFCVVIALVVSLIGLAYYQAWRCAWVLTTLALIYDYKVTTLLNQQTQSKYFPIFQCMWIFTCISNSLIIYVYTYNPTQVLMMIAVTQTSDVLQYLIGSHFGRNYIGYISPKKTLEGYFGSLICLYVFALLIPRSTITVYWALGSLGGLVFSWIKRKLNIKDYSNLLGPHGGWIDRTDSLYLTIWYLLLT